MSRAIHDPHRRTILAGAALMACGQGRSARADPTPAPQAGEPPTKAHAIATAITVQHVVIRSDKSFAAVRAALEARLPPLDRRYAALVRRGQAEAARVLLEQAAPLSIFDARDHGTLLRIAGLERRAIQYEIGNPLTATHMTRHVLSAALYAPIRVLLREDADGQVAFEYDSPATLFGQFQDANVDRVARDLDDQLRSALTAVAKS